MIVDINPPKKEIIQMTKRLKPHKFETKLEKHVRCWLNSHSQSCKEASIESALRDLSHGCSSGIVSHLVYYVDTNKFFLKYRDEISTLLASALGDTGCDLPGLFGDNWDECDQLANEPYGINRNTLAWFAFEESANRVADMGGIQLW